MPIFARRRLQAMLIDIAPLLDDSKTRDLLRRLENKRVDQVLPAEMELALLWGLARVGDLEIEPGWWESANRPDASSKVLIPGETSVIEIAAPNDNAIGGEEAMDAVALRFSAAASRLRKGVGDYLYFSFGQESGYEEGTYYRRRLVPLDYELSDSALQRLATWINGGDLETTPLRIVEPGLDVAIEKRSHKQERYHNVWSAMPPETHSIKDNPLYTLLDRKRSQLRSGPQGIRRLIFLADVGSTLLRRIGQVGEIDPTRRFVSGREIISSFVTANADSVDSVIVFAPTRPMRQWGPVELHWTVSVFNRPSFSFDFINLNALTAILPKPKVEGYQARSLFRQGMFHPSSMGLYLVPRITTRNGGPMTVRLSARALMDLLANRIDRATFDRETGGLALKTNLFEVALNRGKTIRDVTFESGGLGEDDDYLVLTLDDDVGARTIQATTFSQADDAVMELDDDRSATEVREDASEPD